MRNALLLMFYTFAGLLATVIILGALELNGQHTSSEDAFLGWSLALTFTGALGSLLGLLARGE